MKSIRKTRASAGGVSSQTDFRGRDEAKSSTVARARRNRGRRPGFSSLTRSRSKAGPGRLGSAEAPPLVVDPAEAMSRFANAHELDLVMLSPQPSSEASGPIKPSLAEAIVRTIRARTLFVPRRPGLVDAQTGAVRLRRILILSTGASSQGALDAAVALVEGRTSCGTFTVLHVGFPEVVPFLLAAELPGWETETVLQTGDVATAVLEVGEAQGADLIVLVAGGRHSPAGSPNANTIERVLRAARCPVLVVPAR